MSHEERTSKNSSFNSRSRSGNDFGNQSSRGNRGSRWPNSRWNRGNSHSRYQGDNSAIDGRRSSHEYSTHPASQLKAKDDEANSYAVNLLLDPINMGITARNGQWEKTFQGIGAFKHYFGLCAPTDSLGYTLPDIWDGYFHITLAKFFSSLSQRELKDTFKEFCPSLEDIPYIPNILFGSSRIEMHSGGDRGPDLSGIDFVVLPIEDSAETKTFYEKVQALLVQIKEQAKATDWYVTPRSQLHVTIRKYSNFSKENLKKIKVQEFPLQFRCCHLEIRQPRQQATKIHKKTNTYKWWNGVTEEGGKCTGCQGPVMSQTWEGFCLACGQYETMIPFWATAGIK